MTGKTFATMKDLKVGKYVLIDDIPCKIVNIESSAPGKHGAAKVRVTGIGVFNGEKKTLLKPGDADCEVPIIDRKSAQVVSVSGGNVQLMDSQTFEVFELPIPDDLKGEIEAGKEVDLMETMGKKIITRVK